MILADKIIKERKKLGLSQEELAEKMDVSRQAVSKWEGAQSIPDIDKILQLSELFGVTTDYLLKDNIESEENSAENSLISHTEDKAVNNIRTVTMKEAETFLFLRNAASRKIAVGTFLCILSVIPLFLLTSGCDIIGISEDMAAALGLAFLLIVVAGAVGLFMHAGFKSAPYEFLEKEPFETENGVSDMVREQKETFDGTYTKFNIIGAILCILSPIPLFISYVGESDFMAVVSLCVTLVIAGIGSVCFILAGVRRESMEKLLKEGDYSEATKKTSTIKGIVSAIYWLVATAIYLLMLFLSGGQESGWRSDYSWLVWPVAGVLFPVVLLICDAIQKKEQQPLENEK